MQLPSGWIALGCGRLPRVNVARPPTVFISAEQKIGRHALGDKLS